MSENAGTVTLRLSKHAMALEEERKVLEVKIEAYTRETLALKRRMNTMILIACLPPEILGFIFQYYKDNTETSIRSTRESWLKITHVCHDWREVALGLPRLWSDIYVGSQGDSERVRAYFERSKAAPLHLHVSQISAKPSLELLIPQLARAESLDVHVPAGPLIQDIVNLLPPSAPVLKKLSVRCSAYQNPLTSPFIAPTFFLANCKAPNLKDLAFNGFRVEWKEHVLPDTLTRLEISSTADPNSNPSMTQVIQAISHLHALEHLDIRRSDRDAAQPTLAITSANTRGATFDRLRYVKLCVSVEACVQFFRGCAIPLLAVVVLDFSSWPWPADAAPLIPCIAPRVEAWGPLMLSVENQRLSFLRDTLPSSRSVGPADSDSGMCLCIVGSSYRNHDHIRDVCVHLPLSTLAKIEIKNSTSFNFSGESWRTLMTRCVNVEDLDVNGASDYNPYDSLSSDRVLAVLGWRWGFALVKDEDRCLLPKLQRVHLSQIRFPAYRDDDEDVPTTDDFVRLLLARKEANTEALEDIVLHRCINLQTSDVEWLQEKADVLVVWDGIIQIEEDEESESEDEDAWVEYDYYDEHENNMFDGMDYDDLLWHINAH